MVVTCCHLIPNDQSDRVNYPHLKKVMFFVWTTVSDGDASILQIWEV